MPMDTQSQFFVLHCSLLGKNRSHGCIKCFKNKVVLHLKKKAWAKLFSTLETNCATANSSCGSALSENNCPVGGEYVKKKMSSMQHTHRATASWEDVWMVRVQHNVTPVHVQTFQLYFVCANRFIHHVGWFATALQLGTPKPLRSIWKWAHLKYL